MFRLCWIKKRSLISFIVAQDSIVQFYSIWPWVGFLCSNSNILEWLWIYCYEMFLWKNKQILWQTGGFTKTILRLSSLWPETLFPAPKRIKLLWELFQNTTYWLIYYFEFRSSSRKGFGQRMRLHKESKGECNFQGGERIESFV